MKNIANLEYPVFARYKMGIFYEGFINYISNVLLKVGNTENIFWLIFSFYR